MNYDLHIMLYDTESRESLYELYDFSQESAYQAL